MNCAESIVRMLESVGVEALFSGSGQGPGELLLAFANSKKIRTIMTRHEQAASFMAYGYATFSKKLGVCNVQGGPGSVNLISGIGMAYTGSCPLLTISSYAPQKFRGKGDLGEVTGLNRTPNSQIMFGATTKKTYLIDRPAILCDLFEEAVHLAFNGRPGPVHLDIPYDITAAEQKHHRDISLQITPILPKDKDVELFAEYLAQAIQAKKKVVALFGFGCVLANAGPELKEFVERFQIPFMTTMDAKGILPDNHPLALGMTGVSGDPGAKQAFKAADVVLAIGNSFAKWQTWIFEKEIFDQRILMHINFDVQEINRVYKANFSMVSDAKFAMQKLNQALASKVTVAEPARPVIERYCFAKLDYSGRKVHPGQLSQLIGRLLPERAIVLGDAGAHMIWLAAYMQLNGGQTYKNPGSFGPMASHTNGAIGAYVAAPDRRIIVGCGDGCYQMAGFELMTAVEHRMPIIWIIFNNGEFGIIKTFNQLTLGREVLTRLAGPNFAGYAEACGAQGFRVERLDQFEPAFRAALASDRPSVMDVIIDEEEKMPLKMYNPAKP